MPERVADEVADIVRALPPAILWALVAVGLIALVLAVNAFWQWRRRTALEAQRAELLDDIGVLSRALLPPVPGGLDGLAVTAAYRPADGPAAGGDFYDVFVIDERRVCVLVGDVSGHGRESVTQAALARYTLRTLLAAGHAPGEALARADALLLRDLQPNFVTVIAGVYDPVDRRAHLRQGRPRAADRARSGARPGRRAAGPAAGARLRRDVAGVPRAARRGRVGLPVHRRPRGRPARRRARRPRRGRSGCSRHRRCPRPAGCCATSRSSPT